LLRRLRLRRRRLRLLRLPPPDLLLLSPPALAGATCVNLAISFASCSVELRLPYEPYDAARRLGDH
jgi:hypothetical protein